MDIIYTSAYGKAVVACFALQVLTPLYKLTRQLMAHGRRDNQPQSSGLLSGVFNFVSREIESFVTTATGREVGIFHLVLATLTNAFTATETS